MVHVRNSKTEDCCTLTYINIVKMLCPRLCPYLILTVYGFEFVLETCIWVETQTIGLSWAISVDTWTWLETWAICVIELRLGPLVYLNCTRIKTCTICVEAFLLLRYNKG
jgi:hypothetical protein